MVTHNLYNPLISEGCECKVSSEITASLLHHTQLGIRAFIILLVKITVQLYQYDAMLITVPLRKAHNMEE